MTTAAEELAHADAQRLLREAPLLHLAYLGADGAPRVIPIGFHWDGDAAIICTATTSPKARALARRPHVAISIDEGATPADAKALQLRGTATVEIVDGVPEEYLAGARKAMPPEQIPVFEEACRRMYPQMARIRVVPDWARFFDFGNGRLPGFLGQLVQDAQRRSDAGTGGTPVPPE